MSTASTHGVTPGVPSIRPTIYFQSRSNAVEKRVLGMWAQLSLSLRGLIMHGLGYAAQ